MAAEQPKEQLQELKDCVQEVYDQLKLRKIVAPIREMLSKYDDAEVVETLKMSKYEKMLEEMSKVHEIVKAVTAMLPGVLQMEPLRKQRDDSLFVYACLHDDLMINACEYTLECVNLVLARFQEGDRQ